MNYKNVTVPYLHFSEIEERAELFKKTYWGEIIPVEIETIIEIKLKIRIIPIPGFAELTDINALSTSDWKSIYVDDDEYNDERRYCHLRFSLGHEIGHFILHKRILQGLDIKNYEDFCKLNKNFPDKQYYYLEHQANKFASYLLIPRKKLFIEREKQLKKLDSSLLQKIDNSKINSFLEKPLSKIFNVSEKAIEIALEDL